MHELGLFSRACMMHTYVRFLKKSNLHAGARLLWRKARLRPWRTCRLATLRKWRGIAKGVYAPVWESDVHWCGYADEKVAKRCYARGSRVQLALLFEHVITHTRMRPTWLCVRLDIRTNNWPRCNVRILIEKLICNSVRQFLLWSTVFRIRIINDWSSV